MKQQTTTKPRLSDLDRVDNATGEDADEDEEEEEQQQQQQDPRLTCR